MTVMQDSVQTNGTMLCAAAAAKATAESTSSLSGSAVPLLSTSEANLGHDVTQLCSHVLHWKCCLSSL